VRPLDGGYVALVCAATHAGRAVIVKVTPRGHPDDAQLVSEGAALDFWRPTGAVPALVSSTDDGFTLLMERLLPGLTLDDAGLAWEDELTILAGLAARLHSAGAPPDGFVGMTGYRLDWRGALADDPGLLAELEALATPGPADVLVHADLHAGNALRHGDSWKAIDPHAVRGDRHADIWALLDPKAPLPDDQAGAARAVKAWVAHYAQAAGMDAQRAATWTRIRARAEAAAAGDADWAAHLNRVADSLR